MSEDKKILKRAWVVNNIEEFQRVVDEHRAFEKQFKNQSLIFDTDTIDIVDNLRDKTEVLYNEKLQLTKKGRIIQAQFNEFKDDLRKLNWFQRVFRFKHNIDKLIDNLNDENKQSIDDIYERLQIRDEQIIGDEF